MLLVALAGNASAHEKWFHETENYGLRWDLFFRPLPLLLFGAVIIATAAAGLWWRKRGRGFVPGPENFGANERAAGGFIRFNSRHRRHSRCGAAPGQRRAGRTLYAE